MKPVNLSAADLKLQEDEDLFRLQLSLLARGAASTPGNDGNALVSVDEQAASLTMTIAQHLRDGRLTETMTRLLANYLETMDAQKRWALLALNSKNRRPSALGKNTNAVYAFTEALKQGLPTDDALIAAYDAYFAVMPYESGAEPTTYKRDSQKATSPRCRHPTLAAQRMATVIRPCLVKAGLLPPGKPGRPKKAI